MTYTMLILGTLALLVLWDLGRRATQAMGNKALEARLHAMEIVLNTHEDVIKDHGRKLTKEQMQPLARPRISR